MEVDGGMNHGPYIFIETSVKFPDIFQSLELTGVYLVIF